MSLLERLGAVRRRAVARLPKAFVQRVESLKQALPLRLMQSAPVIQAFLDDGDTRSYLGLHNFYSVLLPDFDTSCDADIVFHDAIGKIALRHRLRLAPHGSAMVDVRALLDQHRLRIPVGVVTAQLTPESARDRRYRQLGLVTSQFFVHFESAHGSVGQIHPLSVAEPGNLAAGPFVSSQVVTSFGLAALNVVQYNATRRRHRLQHRLFDLDSGETVATRAMLLAPLGAGVARFVIDERVQGRYLGFAVDDLPSSNAKPVLRRVYKSGLFSVSHS